MTRPTSGAGPGNDSGPVVTRATTSALNLDLHTVPQTKDSPAHRRLALHHMLVRRPRWSDALDELLAEVESEVLADLEPGVTGDYWAATLMDRGVDERDRRGRELLAAGFVPRWSA